MGHFRAAARARGLVLGAATLAFAVRALPWRTVLDPTGVRFFDADGYYHLRRIVHVARHFPETLAFDPYLGFPDGGRAIWTPVFDVCLGLLARGLVGGEPGAVERLVVWAPPLLGALCVAATTGISLRLFGSGAALVSGTLLALLPAHAHFAQVGYVDHHVATALAAALLLSGALSVLAAFEEDRPGASPARWAGLGLLLGGSLLVWPGCLLHVGLVEAGLLALLVTRRDAENARRAARGLMLAHGLAAALVLPFAGSSDSTHWGAFHPAVLSFFQPWLLAGLALVAAAWPRLALRGGAAPTPARGLAAAVVLGLTLLGTTLLAFPGALATLGDAWAWFARTESFQAQVAESQPLFLPDGRFSVAVAERQLGRAFYALPLLLAWLWAASRGRPDAARRRLVAGFCAGLGAAALVQHRFVNCFSVPYALVLGWAGADLARRFARRLRGRGGRRAAAAGGIALALLLFAPTRGYYADPLDRELRRGLPIPVDALAERKLRLIETARWLREHTPPTSGWEDERGRPEYGVLGSWTDGHVLRYEARRPVVVDNFGDDLDPARFALALEYLAAGEPRAVEVLDALRARYAVVHFPTEAFGPASMQARLYFHDGSATTQSVAFREGRFESVAGEAAALAHHRLVYESDGLSFGPLANRQLPAFKVFQRVAGARLEGRAPPGAEVALRLPLRTNRGRTFVWQARARADAEGRFAFPAPYSTRPATRVTGAMGPYRVSVAGEEVRVPVSEAVVASGAVVQVPAFAAGDQRGPEDSPSSR